MVLVEMIAKFPFEKASRRVNRLIKLSVPEIVRLTQRHVPAPPC